MTFLISLLYCCSLWQAITPYKPNDEFKLELEYKFKQRPATNNSRFDFEVSEAEVQKKKYGSGSLPYLVVIFKIVKLSNEEARIKIINGKGQNMLSKKAATEVAYKMDLGYTDDMKDRVTPHEFFIFLLTADRKEVSVVKLFIKEDGTFLVNDEVRGKF